MEMELVVSVDRNVALGIAEDLLIPEPAEMRSVRCQSECQPRQDGIIYLETAITGRVDQGCL